MSKFYDTMQLQIAISHKRDLTTLSAFTFDYLDIDDKRYIHDSKSLNVLRESRQKFVILKPDKGQIVVLVDHRDYVNSMQGMFDEASKFKKIEKDYTSDNCTKFSEDII